MWAMLGALGVAFASGAGGVTLDGMWMPDLGPASAGWSGAAACVGGQGFTRLGALRVGGEGRGCFGPVRGALGGVQVGAIATTGRAHWSAYTTFGGGSLRSAPTGRFGYLYVQPTVTVGWSTGRAGFEVGPYVQVPFHIVDSSGPLVVSPGTPHLGAQLSVLFGDWNAPRRAVQVAEPVPTAPPPAAPAPPAPDRPLAIPGGAPPPLEGPR